MCKSCRVSWCNELIEEGANGNIVYCKIHRQYKTYARNAISRPWLFYKMNKIEAGEIKCENCGYDPRDYYPDRDIHTLVGLFDIDHINSSLKHTEEGEQPSNYQMLCKNCHILKTYDEGDFIPKIS